MLVARFVLSNRISSTATTAPTDGETSKRSFFFVFELFDVEFFLDSSFDASCELRKSLEFRTGRAQFIESGPPGTDERSKKNVQLLIKKDQCRRQGRSDAKKFKQRSCIEQKKLGRTSKPLEKDKATQVCMRFYQVYRREAEKEQNTNWNISSRKACRSGYLAGCVNWMTEKLYY